jgi:Flp pilus assembly pilin Flp
MLGFKNFILEEDGIGVVEMILILVVLIGLVLTFKSKLTTLVGNIFDTITSKSGTV